MLRVILLLLFNFAAMSVVAQEDSSSTPSTIKPTIVSFPSNGLTLKGALYVPAGKGPFPAIIWNHGSEKAILANGQPETQPWLAEFYTQHGYIFFLPWRHGQGLSPGEYIMDRVDQAKKESHGNVDEFVRKFINIQLFYNEDVVNAVSWLESQSYTDKNRIAISGCSFGGIQTLATVFSEKKLGIKAFVPFAPGAMSWDNMPPLHVWESDLVKTADKPMFLMQAKNDYSLGPSKTLGPILVNKGGLNRYKIYPPFLNPNDHKDGHYPFATWPKGIAIWGDDVLEFLTQALQ